MKQKLTNNLGLKILAVIVSIALWLIAINITDPVSQDSYNITVALQNVNKLATAGKYVEVVDSTDKIRVTVRGTRSALSAFSISDIVATADLTKLTEDNRVPIEISTTKNSDKIEGIKADEEYVQLNVENISKVQMPIEVLVQNSPQEGFILGSTSTTQNVVIVSGPESVVSTVDSAAVEINVAEASSDVNISLPIHLYDNDGRTIDASKISLSVSEVSTTASILQTKTLPVICEARGTLLDGYVLTGKMEGIPESITVAGKPSVIKKLSAIDISNAIDVTGAYADASFSVILNDYLPDGVTIVGDSDNGLINVVVGIVKESSAVYDIDPDAIHITGVPEGYSAELTEADEPVAITLTGLSDVLDEVDDSDLAGVVDIGKYISDNDVTVTAGHMDVPVDIIPPEGTKLGREVKVNVTLKSDN